jgi:hypothetical protein
VTKVVGIQGGKKPEDACLFCDGQHQTLKCPRVAYLELFEDGSVASVRFFKPEIWNPPR